MKRIAVLMVLCLFGTILVAGCGTSDTTGVDSKTPYFVSHDPVACKNIDVKCEEVLDYTGHYGPFSDETGCGCRWELYKK